MRKLKSLPLYVLPKNNYKGKSYRYISRDMGIGITQIHRFRKHIPNKYDDTHVLSDVVYILYNYKMEQAMRYLRRYLYHINPELIKLKSEIMLTLLGERPEYEGTKHCYPEVDLYQIPVV